MSTIIVDERSQVLRDLAARGTDAVAMQDQVRRVAGCEQPVRLSGRVDLVDSATGDVRRTWSTSDEPDGTVLVACGNRRASRCAPCARLYQGDSYQLIVAGLRGGKGVPDTVRAHPALFVTLTAPSFGPVHTAQEGRRCHPRDGLCEHGRVRGCLAVHEAGDELLGQPVCEDCFDYEAAVLWNGHAGELWRRTRIGITRQLARLRGVPERRVKAAVRVEYVKVAEYQRRGLLHFHLAIRLDPVDPASGLHDGYTADLFAQAVTAAVATAAAPYPQPLGAGQGLEEPPQEVASATLDAPPDPDRGPARPARGGYPAHALRPPQLEDAAYRLPVLELADRPALRAARWGDQLHLAPLPSDDPQAEQGGVLSRQQVAGYLAKYATKHTEALGAALDRRVTAKDLPMLATSPHIRRFVTTALVLAGRYPRRVNGRPLRLDRWAHQLGYGGHWLTKSRRWSTTYTALRNARKQHQAAARPDAYQARPGEQAQGAWRMVDIGYRLTLDALLADGVRDDDHTGRAELRQLRQREQELRALAA